MRAHVPSLPAGGMLGPQRRDSVRNVQDDAIWLGVDRLVDRAPLLADLRSHRLELFAVRRWRAQGRPVPAELEREAQLAAVPTLAAAPLVERVRAAYDGPALVLKGPEVAARYPDPGLRPYRDLDLLVPDAAGVQRALVEHGFREIGDPDVYRDIHHLRPLAWPGIPLALEVHAHPKWLPGFAPPRVEELLEASVQSVLTGLLALHPAHHALVLAAHSWAHEPLRRLRDLVDVAAVAAAADGGEIERHARAWSVQRLWAVTRAAADAALLGGPTPWALRVWALNLTRVRERTVLENHLQSVLSDFSVRPPAAAAAGLPGRLVAEIRRQDEETWSAKLGRSVRAFRNAHVRRSKHDLELEELTRRRAERGR